MTISFVERLKALLQLIDYIFLFAGVVYIALWLGNLSERKKPNYKKGIPWHGSIVIGLSGLVHICNRYIEHPEKAISKLGLVLGIYLIGKGLYKKAKGLY